MGHRLNSKHLSSCRGKIEAFLGFEQQFGKDIQNTVITNTQKKCQYSSQLQFKSNIKKT